MSLLGPPLPDQAPGAAGTEVRVLPRSLDSEYLDCAHLKRIFFYGQG